MIEKLGINNIIELILAIICLVIGSCLWFLIGGCICPNSIEKRWLRATIISLWPGYLAVIFLSIPFVVLYIFTKR